MRRNFSKLLLAIALILNLSTNHLFAISKQKAKDRITVELTFGEFPYSHKFYVPIDSSSENSKPTGGNFATVDCIDCELTSEYGFIAVAHAISEDSSRLNFNLSFGGRHKECEVAREIIITRGKNTKIKLKCGVKVSAYYES